MAVEKLLSASSLACRGVWVVRSFAIVTGPARERREDLAPSKRRRAFFLLCRLTGIEAMKSCLNRYMVEKSEEG